jgi:hypothetical protein
MPKKEDVFDGFTGTVNFGVRFGKSGSPAKSQAHRGVVPDKGKGHSSRSPLRSASPARRNLNIERLVDTFPVQHLHHLRHCQLKDLADAAATLVLNKRK